LPLKKFFFSLLFVIAQFFGSAVFADELNIYFKTTPRSELLRPFVDSTDLSLLITGADGRALKQGTVTVRLDAPRSGRVFSTDYPLVEGTVLSEMQLPLRQGRANWKQLLPIRGEYRLRVEVAANGAETSKVFTFYVRESRQKWLALAALSAGLFILGFVAGRIFTGVRAGTAMTMIGFALLTSATEISHAQPDRPVGRGILEVESAIVGKPAFLRWRMAATGNHGARGTLTLTVTHLEKQKVVFGVEKIGVDGEWSSKFHFFDGGEYRVVAVGNVPGLAPVRSEHVIAVTGVEPPVRTMITVLVYFVTLIALGLGLGRWSKRLGRVES